ncbi:hypothetical protein [uncultured Clostridium sp.]
MIKKCEKYNGKFTRQAFLCSFMSKVLIGLILAARAKLLGGSYEKS